MMMLQFVWLHAVQKANLNIRSSLNLQPLVDPFDRLQHILGCMDTVKAATSSRFLEELEK
jgi:hypothetical protein